MAFRIQIRRDTAANWAINNPVLLQAEMGYVTDTDQAKFGNGVDPWNDLAYFAPGGSGSSVAVVGPSGQVSAGATGIEFTGSGVQSVTASGNFVTVTITGGTGSGTSGTSGSSGSSGTSGSSGSSGTSGAAGSSGSSGTSGAAGSSGSSGTSGSSGSSGESGSSGSSGTSGAAGSSGSSGTSGSSGSSGESGKY